MLVQADSANVSTQPSQQPTPSQESRRQSARQSGDTMSEVSQRVLIGPEAAQSRQPMLRQDGQSRHVTNQIHSQMSKLVSRAAEEENLLFCSACRHRTQHVQSATRHGSETSKRGAPGSIYTSGSQRGPCLDSCLVPVSIMSHANPTIKSSSNMTLM